MANQSVGIPRFWIDFTQLAKAKGNFLNPTSDTDPGSVDISYGEAFGYGNTTGFDDIFADKNMDVWNFDYTNTTNFLTMGSGSSTWKAIFFNPTLEWAKLFSTINWVGFINHNIFTSIGTTDLAQLQTLYFWNNGYAGSGTFVDPAVNHYVNGDFSQDGYSIFTFDFNPYGNPFGNWEDYRTFQLRLAIDSGVSFDLGAISFGKYIDMPNSPDLQITKSIEYDGTKTVTSLGGSSFSETRHHGQPDWLVGEPWTLKDYESSGRVGRNGRRSWDLNFSYISNDDLFYDLSERVVGGTSDINSSDSTEGDFNSTDEIQQIWDLTLGGALSFLFTPDKDATNPEFAVCRLDQESLSVTQIANGVWNIKMRVVEVW